MDTPYRVILSGVAVREANGNGVGISICFAVLAETDRKAMLTEIVEFAVYLFRRFKREERLRKAVGWSPARAEIVETKVLGGRVQILYTYQFREGYFSNFETREFF